MPKKIEISHRTIIFAIAAVAGAWFLFYIRDLILGVFVAILIMAVLNPTVDRLQRYKVPRALAIVAVYLSILGIFVAVFIGVIPPLIDQTPRLIERLPGYLSIIVPPSLGEQFVNEGLAQLGSLPSHIVRVVVSVVTNLFTLVFVFSVAFYLLLARKNLDGNLEGFLPAGTKTQIVNFVVALEEKLGGWLRGQIVLMTIVGLVTYLGLTLLGVPFAIPLSLLAGLMEIIPYIGPTLAVIPAALVGFGVSPVTGAAVLALYFLIQQLENNLIVPKVMQKSVGLSPLVIIIALAMGIRLAGLVGGLLAVPFVIVGQVAVKQFFPEKLA